MGTSFTSVVRSDLTTEEIKLRQGAREFSEAVVRPYSKDWDTSTDFPWELAKKFAEAGYLSLYVPEEHGGQGGSFFDMCLVMEEVARVDPNLCVLPQEMMNWGPFMLGEIGSDYHKQKYYPRIMAGEALFVQGLTESHAGSSLTDLVTRAVIDGDGVVINGEKWMVSFAPYSTDIIVFCRFGDCVGPYGIGAVIIPTDSDGVTIHDLHTMMRRVGPTEGHCEFHDVRVPPEYILIEGNPATKDAFRTLMSLYDSQRAGACARAVGCAQGAFEEALAWSKERVQFGRRICDFQGTQWKLAKMATKLETARTMYYKAARDIDRNAPEANMSTSVAKAFCNEAAWDVVNEAFQILGSRGYIQGMFTTEARIRHARHFTVAGGTHEMLLNTIAAEVLEEPISQRPLRAEPVPS